MRISNEWQSFEILDASGGEKLERWGEFILRRPDPQIIWQTQKSNIWHSADAIYLTENKKGEWKVKNPRCKSWVINYKNLKFKIELTNQKQVGLFPEQAVNWDYSLQKIKNAKRPVNVLSLFGYTGGAAIACAAAGAKVCHVDAAKKSVEWAKENAKLSAIDSNSIRWIVDDCKKFVAREIKRGNKYDVIVMDPPSFGRGPSGEVWKLEDEIFSFVSMCSKLLSENPLFLMVNSNTTNISPMVMQYVLEAALVGKKPINIFSQELVLEVKSSKGLLPCGSTAVAEFE